jgi:hypothetical protein
MDICLMGLVDPYRLTFEKLHAPQQGKAVAAGNRDLE